MKANLAALRTEIKDYLAARGMVIFPSFQRSADPGPAVFWDTEEDSDYRSFLAAAEAAGARMVTIFARELDEEAIEDAIEQLAETTLEREERRSIESRLRELRAYAGFTCEIELSFDIASRVYIFDIRTEWFDDLNDLIDSIEENFLEATGEDEKGFDGGYFSRN